MRVKRFNETHFILCDEYESVDKLKGRILTELDQIGFKLQGMGDEVLTAEDIRLCHKKRVSLAMETL